MQFFKYTPFQGKAHGFERVYQENLYRKQDVRTAGRGQKTEHVDIGKQILKREILEVAKAPSSLTDQSLTRGDQFMFQDEQQTSELSKSGGRE